MMVSLLLMRRLTAARPTPAPPTRKKTSCSEMGFCAWLALLPSGPDFKQHRRFGLAGIEQQAGENDPVGIGGRHGRGAVDGLERGEAQTHDNGIGSRYADGFAEFVDAGREQQVLALRQLRVDGRGGVGAGMGDVELARAEWSVPA